MPTYVTLMNWTDQGAKTADQTAARYDAAKDDLAQRGNDQGHLLDDGPL